MKMTDILKSWLCALLLLPSPWLLADNAGRQYDIELLIFENLVTSDNGEVWPVDYSEWFEQSYDQANTGADAEPVQHTREWLDRGQFRLTAERDSLARSSQYRPLAHLAWREAVPGRAQAVAFELPVDKSGDSYVDGTVRIAVERYLHLELDLQLHNASLRQPAEGDFEYDTPEIRLTERRRMRSKEAHYFDNPRFGVIALVTPYQTPEAATDSEAPASANATRPASAQ